MFPPPPVPLTSFVGRGATLARLTATIRTGARLVTLTGPGGVGKTRLVIAAADALASAFPNTIGFIPLAAVRDPHLVAFTIAQHLGLAPTPHQTPIQQIEQLLRARTALLILDNFEQLIDAVSVVVSLLSVCPGLSLVVTSQTPLRVSAEHVFPVPPLPLGREEGGTLGQNAGRAASMSPSAPLAVPDAVRLFVERAQAVRPDFALTEANIEAVAGICAHLDGLPLALELAAVNIKLLPPAVLLKTLSQRLPLLTTGPRDAPERQRTMRNAIAWSYDLLSPEEQAFFRRLGVFVGGFVVDAAEVVAGTSPDDDGAFDHELRSFSVLEHIGALVDRSLLRQEETSREHGYADEVAEPRFLMLETVREFALEQLASSGESNDARARHVSWFLNLAERAAAAFTGRGPDTWGQQLEHELGNLRAALVSSDAAGAVDTSLRLATALHPLWLLLGHEREGYDWLTRLLAKGVDSSPHSRRRAQLLASRLAVDLGDLATAEALTTTAESTARAATDQESVADARHLLAAIAKDRGDEATARRLTQEALAIYRERGDWYNTGSALCQLATLGNLGSVDRPGDPNDQAVAEECCAEALDLYREMENSDGIARALHGLAYIAYKRGDYRRAADLSREVLTLRWEYRGLMVIPSHFEDLADIAGVTGHAADAARLYGAAEALRESIGTPIAPFYLSDHEREVAVTRRALAPDDFAAAWSAGRDLPLEESVGEALLLADRLASGSAGAQTDDAPPTTVADRHGLTPRELEILELVVTGQGNRAIAEALYLSPATVKRHVTNILAKLDVATRAEAVSYAHRVGLAPLRNDGD